MNVIVPPIKIQGKKTKLVQKIMEIADEILNEHPEIDTWVEPFLGSGVVAFNCPGRIKKVVVNDINPHIIKFYKGVADGIITSDKIREVFEIHNQNLLNGGVDYYNEIRDRFNQSFDTMDFLFLTRTGFNGVMRFNGSGKWNIPFCKLNNRLSKNVIEDLAGSVNELSKLFKSKEFTFYNKSFEEVIATLDDGLKNNPMIKDYWNDYEIESRDHKYNVAEQAKERNQVKEGLIYPKIQNKYSLF